MKEYQAPGAIRTHRNPEDLQMVSLVVVSIQGFLPNCKCGFDCDTVLV